MSHSKVTLSNEVQTKVLKANSNVTSGQIYQIKSINVHAGDLVPITFSGSGFETTFNAIGYEGFIKFSIPFVTKGIETKLELINGKAKVSVPSLNITLKNIQIKKPILISRNSKRIVIKFFNFIKSVSAEARTNANSQNWTALSARTLNVDSIINTAIEELELTNKITTTYDGITKQMDSEDLDMFADMIAGSVMGIIQENQNERILPVFFEKELDNFFVDWKNFNPESALIALAALDLGGSDTKGPPPSALLPWVGVLAVVAFLFVLWWVYENRAAITNFTRKWTERFNQRCFWGDNCPQLNGTKGCSLDMTNELKQLQSDYDDVLGDVTNSAPEACLTVSNTTGPNSSIPVTFDTSCSADAEDNIHRGKVDYDNGENDAYCGLNTTVKNLNPGNHSATVTVFDSEGLSSQATVNFNVTSTGSGDKNDFVYFDQYILKPFNDLINSTKEAVADFTYFPTSGNFSVEVNFDASISTGPYILNYVWEFSDFGSQTHCWPQLKRSFSQTTDITLSIVNNRDESATSSTKTVFVNTGD